MVVTIHQVTNFTTEPLPYVPPRRRAQASCVMRQKPIQQSEADSNAIRATMAAITKMEQTEILKKQSESIVNAPSDRAPIPESVFGDVNPRVVAYCSLYEYDLSLRPH